MLWNKLCLTSRTILSHFELKHKLRNNKCKSHSRHVIISAKLTKNCLTVICYSLSVVYVIFLYKLTVNWFTSSRCWFGEKNPRGFSKIRIYIQDCETITFLQLKIGRLANAYKPIHNLQQTIKKKKIWGTKVWMSCVVNIIKINLEAAFPMLHIFKANMSV